MNCMDSSPHSLLVFLANSPNILARIRAILVAYATPELILHSVCMLLYFVRIMRHAFSGYSKCTEISRPLPPTQRAEELRSPRQVKRSQPQSRSTCSLLLTHRRQRAAAKTRTIYTFPRSTWEHLVRSRSRMTITTPSRNNSRSQ